MRISLMIAMFVLSAVSCFAGEAVKPAKPIEKVRASEPDRKLTKGEIEIHRQLVKAIKKHRRYWPSDKPVESPASLLSSDKKKFIVKMHPKLYYSEMGCTMLMNQDGESFSELYEVLSFTLKKRSYYHVWGARHIGRAPFRLDRTKEYRFEFETPKLPKDSKNSISLTVLKVWLDGKLLLDRTKKKPKQK